VNAEPVTTKLSAGSAADGLHIRLRPVKGQRGADWSLVLDTDMLTLTTPEGRVVMMLPRDDAVNHVRFLWDVLRGPVLLLEVVPGLKGYHFRKTNSIQNALLEWLPQRSKTRMEFEIRRHGICMLLFTLVLFQLGNLFPTLPVTMINAAGILLLAWPVRRNVGVSALMLSLGGLWLLYHAAFASGLAAIGAYARPAVTAAGAVALLWGIQQTTTASANHRLEAARSEHPDSGAFPQPINVAVWYFAGGLCLLVAGFLGAVMWNFYKQNGATSWELGLHAAPLAATVGMAVILFLRAGRGLLEVKLSAQWLIVVLVVLAYGAWHGDPDPNASLLQAGIRHLSRAHVWVTAVVLILGFNASFRFWLSRQLRQKSGGDT
jgi:hypothetical protein